MLSRALLLLLIAAASLPAAPNFASQIQSGLSLLQQANSNLASWRKSHPADQIVFATSPTNTTVNYYPDDLLFTNTGCAQSIAAETDQPTRVAVFNIPDPPTERLQLAPSPNSSLRDRCELRAILWYSQPGVTWESVVHDLSSAWGAPNAALTRPNLNSSGLWQHPAAWRVGRCNIWLVPANPSANQVFVFAKQNFELGILDLAISFQSETYRRTLIENAANLASQDPTLTRTMLQQAYCERGARNMDLTSLTAWLKASRSLPPEKKAASLVLAHEFMSCTTAGEASLKKLGAHFAVQCPQDGATYDGNFLAQAKSTANGGRATEIAILLSLARSCNTLETAQSELAAVQSPDLKPYLHYLIARAHAVRLSDAYPPGQAETGDVVPLTPIAMQRERAAAIENFRLYLAANAKEPEARYAWNETWRLLAGLRPSRIAFGCGCE